MSNLANFDFIESEDELNKYLIYLDGLRESGATNMFGAAPYLRERFSLSHKQARKILFHWMDTFSERHKESIK